MSWSMLIFIEVLRLLAIFCAGVIVLRCIRVLNKMHLSTRNAGALGYASWLLFGLSYVTLACAATGSAIAMANSDPRVAWHQWLGHLIWMAASAGLILFDRRRRRVVSRSDGGDTTVPPFHGRLTP